MLNKIKNGFTLAEVLITLVIIGVVAALTIPNVIYETKKKEYSSRLKKFYSTMKQAELRAATDGKSWGDFVVTNYSQNTYDKAILFRNEYLLPYLSYTKLSTVAGYQPSVYLNDGSYFYIYKGVSCVTFYYDLNGEKKPNVKGRDMYDFLICRINSKFGPNFESDLRVNSRESALQYCKENAEYCSALLFYDGWEFKDDYPYRL